MGWLWKRNLVSGQVKDINVRSWLGDEYQRLRGDAVAITRKENYVILQGALGKYERWVAQADGIEIWLPENNLRNPF